MRREHFKGQQSYIDWLKSMGCLMYAPLMSDLKDYISGNSFVPTGDGSYSLQDGWCNITTPSSAIRTVLSLTTDALVNNTSKDWTIMCEAQLVQLSPANNSCRITLFSNQAINSEYYPQAHGNCYNSSLGRNTVTNTWDYSATKIARVYYNNEQNFYFYWNGEPYIQLSLSIDITAMSSPQNNGFTIGCTGHNNFRNCSFKIRNFMFFNRALTLKEIREIQGYE